MARIPWEVSACHRQSDPYYVGTPETHVVFSCKISELPFRFTRLHKGYVGGHASKPERPVERLLADCLRLSPKTPGPQGDAFPYPLLTVCFVGIPYVGLSSYTKMCMRQNVKENGTKCASIPVLVGNRHDGRALRSIARTRIPKLKSRHFVAFLKTMCVLWPI